MKLFTIKSYGDEFLTGETNDKRLVLMGLLCPTLVTVFFDANGQYESCVAVDLTTPPPRMGDKGPYEIYDPAFRKSLNQDIEQFKRQNGFSKQPIRVQQFHVDTRGIGIDLLPSHLAEFRQNPNAVAESEEQRKNLQKDLDDWEDAGNFVLCWAKDYWMAPGGEVEST